MFALFVSELVLDRSRALSGDLNLQASGDEKPRPVGHAGISKVPARRYL